MRIIRIVILIVALLFAVYTAVMYFFAEESKSFTVVKEINYPVEKVFPQFNSLQNFVRWNNYFSTAENLFINYYKPYEGQGSALSFTDKKSSRTGELFIRYENRNSTLKYQLFEGKKSNPSLINIKFIPVSAQKTQIKWFVHTPKLPVLKRISNYWTQDKFVENLDKSMINLSNILSNKVEKDNQISSLKFDSIMVEKMEGQLLLGVNVSTSNKKDALYKNIVMNHNKVVNFVTNDLGKSEDEFGFPVLITTPNNFKDKEVSYFYGIPLSKRMAVSDNNFNFRTVNASEVYVIYYKGPYSGRNVPIQKLLQKAKSDLMRNGDIMQTFLETPYTDQNVTMKISLPVFR